MKILRYAANGEAKHGVLEPDGSIRELVGSPYDRPKAGRQVAELGDSATSCAGGAVESHRGVGLNYGSHIEEEGLTAPDFPMLFMKPPTAVIGPEAPIVYPRSSHVKEIGDKDVEFEAELVVVIGREARHVSEENALDYVLGYTCGNDVSARVIQQAEMAMGCLLVGKGFDTFCPLGPVVETDIDPANQQLQARINGQVKQDFNTSDLVFSVPELVSYLSTAITLSPGDVILTGTSAGVGPIAPGDVVEIEASGVGVLRNPGDTRTVRGEGEAGCRIGTALLWLRPFLKTS